MADEGNRDGYYKVVEIRLRQIDDDLKEVKRRLDGNYVTRDQFEPVKTVVYSMIGIVMLGVLSAMMTMLLRGGK